MLHIKVVICFMYGVVSSVKSHGDQVLVVQLFLWPWVNILMTFIIDLRPVL